MISFDPESIASYQKFYEKLESYDAFHCLPSNWLVYSQQTAQDIYDNLSKSIKQRDYLLINEFGDDYQGWMSGEVESWLNKRKLKRCLKLV
jgi:hypothetical protein